MVASVRSCATHAASLEREDTSHMLSKPTTCSLIHSSDEEGRGKRQGRNTEQTKPKTEQLFNDAAGTTRCVRTGSNCVWNLPAWRTEVKDVDVILPKASPEHLGHHCKQIGEESLQTVISHAASADLPCHHGHWHWQSSPSSSRRDGQACSMLSLYLNSLPSSCY